MGVALFVILLVFAGWAIFGSDSQREASPTTSIPPQSDAPNDSDSAQQPSTTVSQPPPDSAVVGGGIDGPLLYAAPPATKRLEGARVDGTIELDNGCLYIRLFETPWLRYPTVWPSGTRWQVAPVEAVVLADGTAAEIGSRVSSAGGFHEPSDLWWFTSAPDLVAEATSCLESETNEIAVLQGVVTSIP